MSLRVASIYEELPAGKMFLLTDMDSSKLVRLNESKVKEAISKYGVDNLSLDENDNLVCTDGNLKSIPDIKQVDKMAIALRYVGTGEKRTVGYRVMNAQGQVRDVSVDFVKEALSRGLVYNAKLVTKKDRTTVSAIKGSFKKRVTS